MGVGWVKIPQSYCIAFSLKAKLKLSQKGNSNGAWR
jgi:hypothetical protein